MSAEMGAKNSYLPPDHKVTHHLDGIAGRPYHPLYPDPDASYAATLEYDASTIQPMVACPHAVDRAKPVSDVTGTPIHQAFLGTCTNGRLEDLAEAASILEGRQVAPGVRLIVIPASAKVYMDALKAGHLETLVSAGALVESPGCGPCMGNHLGIPAVGEVTISSANRNFQGRMGTRESDIYLASPGVVAASAAAGSIVHPNFFKEGNR